MPDVSRSGVYAGDAASVDVREAAKRARLTWRDVDLSEATDKAAFLAACARDLRFPRWFGGNWDAFADCLKDLPADCVVNCRGARRFATMAPDDYATALEVFRDAASYFVERGAVFIVLLDDAPAGVALPRLPGT